LGHFEPLFDQPTLSRLVNERNIILQGENNTGYTNGNSASGYDKCPSRNAVSPSIKVCPKPLQSPSILSDQYRSNGLSHEINRNYRNPVIHARSQIEESDSELTPTNRRKTIAIPITSGGQYEYVTRNQQGNTFQQLTFNNPSPNHSCVQQVHTTSEQKSPRINQYNIQSSGIGNSKVGSYESNGNNYSFGATLDRKSPIKRRLDNVQFMAGSTQQDDCLNRDHFENSAICVSRISKDFPPNSPRMASPSHQTVVKQCESMVGYLGKQQLRKKQPPASPKRTHFSKIKSQAVTIPPVDQTQPSGNNMSYMYFGPDVKMNEIEFIEKTSGSNCNSLLPQPQSARLSPKIPLLCNPNQIPHQTPLNYVDLTSAECLLGDAIKYLEQTSFEQNGDSGMRYSSCNTRQYFPIGAGVNHETRMSGIKVKTGGAEARLAGLGAAVQRSPRNGNLGCDYGREHSLNNSNISLESVGSGGTTVDSNTLPFANENVGTIKQRIALARPSIIMSKSEEPPNVMLTDENMDAINYNHQHTNMTSSLPECSSGS